MTNTREDQHIGILDLLRELDRHQDAEALYDTVHQTLAQHVMFDRLAIGLVDGDTRRITTVYDRGMSTGLPVGHETLPPDQRSLTLSVVRDGASVLHTVPPDVDAYRGDAIRRQFGLWQVLITPIVIDGGVYGVLKIYSNDPRRFDNGTVALVEAYSRALGLAIAAKNATTVPRWQSIADEVLADTASRIARAERVEQLADDLHRGLHEATGASTIRLMRNAHGTYELAEARYMTALRSGDQQVAQAANEIASQIPELIAQDEAQFGRPRTTLFMDAAASVRSSVQARPLGSVADPITTPGLILTPLHTGREVLGAIVGAWPANTSPEHIAGCALFFDRLGDLVGPALHRLLLLDRLEQRLSEIETIRRLTDSIARTPEFQEALEIICRTAQLLTGQDFIGIAETATDHMTWHAAAGALDTGFLHRHIAGPNHVLKRVLHGRQDIVMEDVRQDVQYTPEIMPIHMRENLRSSVIVPVYVNASLRAIMIFGSRRLRRYSTDEIANLHSLAATVATAFASADARLRATDNAQT